MTQDEAADIIERLRQSVRHEDCWTCDCLQGLLVQLEIDGGPQIEELVAAYKVSKERMHGCLGCDPCPPGEVYTAYLSRKCHGDCCGDKE